MERSEKKSVLCLMMCILSYLCYDHATVGAGILAIPAVTQEASAVTCVCWVFKVSMAKRTLGSDGVQVACWLYIFIHYALLVAYVARSSEILNNFLDIPPSVSAATFTLLLGGVCYSGRLLGSFAAIVVVAGGDLQWDALLKVNFQAVPFSIPIIALSCRMFPVLCTDLEGDLPRVRGTWGGVILGSISNLQNEADKIVGPIVQAFSLLAIATSYIGLCWDL